MYACHQLIHFSSDDYENMYTLIITINSSSPSAAYMRQWTEWALVQVMACRLFDTKPLPEPILNIVN